MIGITLLPEQIRAAPPEVRRWLEAEIAQSFAANHGAPTLTAETRHLVACNVEEARSILALIQGMLPVVQVFFELGRDPLAMTAEGLRLLRLDQMMQHAHLRTPDQLVACLEAIDAALQRVRGEPGMTLTALDNSGHCLVADATARSILAVWQDIVASHNLVRAEAAPIPASQSATPFSAPYAISVPPMAAPSIQGETPG